MERYTKVYENSVEDRILYKSKWHTIGLCGDSYEYVSKVPGVCILPFRDDGSVLIRMENNPIYGKFPTCITGMIDDGESPLETCIRELHEEAGILAPSELFVEIGSVYAGKDRYSQDFMFTVNCTGLSQEAPIGDGSDDEKNSENIWVDRKTANLFAYNSTCCYLKSILGQLYFALNS